MIDLEELIGQSDFVSRSEIKEPISTTLSWKPLSAVTANFNTAVMKVVSPNRIEFSRSNGMGCFALIFILVGLTILTLSIAFYALFGIDDYADYHTYIVPFAGLVFIGGGILFLKVGNKKVVFDKAKNATWQGAFKHEELTDKQMQSTLSLTNIAALQLLTYTVSGEKSYSMIQVNIISKGGDRVNIVDYSDGKTAVADILILSGFLEAPIWGDI